MTRAESVRAQLERILGNPLFSVADRRTRLLRFLVEETLSGSGASLKESLLAVEVFGRTGDHDPKIDSLVRVEMGRLRSRLIEYYAQSGRDDLVRIEIPKADTNQSSCFAMRSWLKTRTPPRHYRLPYVLAGGSQPTPPQRRLSL